MIYSHSENNTNPQTGERILEAVYHCVKVLPSFGFSDKNNLDESSHYISLGNRDYLHT